jgi:hypothetical protein
MPISVEDMLGTLNDESQVTKRLTSWETDFVESLTDQHERGQTLSDRQREILEGIYAEKTA